ncbi:MAG TPA: hypothetical protein VGH94_14120 [Acidimicrobiales bacterium]
MGVAALVALLALLGAGVGPAMAATAWRPALAAGSKGQARSQASPAAPTTITATCTSSSAKTVQVAWSAVPRATSYTIYRSTTSSSSGFTSLATGVVGTSWTSAVLAAGSNWFRVTASVGTNWLSAQSSSSGLRTISSSGCT